MLDDEQLLQMPNLMIQSAPTVPASFHSPSSVIGVGCSTLKQEDFHSPLFIDTISTTTAAKQDQLLRIMDPDAYIVSPSQLMQQSTILTGLSNSMADDNFLDTIPDLTDIDDDDNDDDIDDDGDEIKITDDYRRQDVDKNITFTNSNDGGGIDRCMTFDGSSLLGDNQFPHHQQQQQKRQHGRQMSFSCLDAALADGPLPPNAIETLLMELDADDADLTLNLMQAADSLSDGKSSMTAAVDENMLSPDDLERWSNEMT